MPPPSVFGREHIGTSVAVLSLLVSFSSPPPLPLSLWPWPLWANEADMDVFINYRHGLCPPAALKRAVGQTHTFSLCAARRELSRSKNLIIFSFLLSFDLSKGNTTVLEVKMGFLCSSSPISIAVMLPQDHNHCDLCEARLCLPLTYVSNPTTRRTFNHRLR